VIRLVEQARAVDDGDGAFLVGAHIDQLDGGAALDERLQIGRRQLTNWGKRPGSGEIGQRSRFSPARPVWSTAAGQPMARTRRHSS
jgi:hypothetical protein